MALSETRSRWALRVRRGGGPLGDRRQPALDDYRACGAGDDFGGGATAKGARRPRDTRSPVTGCRDVGAALIRPTASGQQHRANSRSSEPAGLLSEKPSQQGLEPSDVSGRTSAPPFAYFQTMATRPGDLVHGLVGCAVVATTFSRKGVSGGIISARVVAMPVARRRPSP
jgi:hypothetical protein